MVHLTIKNGEDWKLGRVNYKPTKEEMLILEKFPYDEVASLKDAFKIITGIKILITVIKTDGRSKELSDNANLIRHIMEFYIDTNVLTNMDAFTYLAIDSMPPHIISKFNA